VVFQDFTAPPLKPNINASQLKKLCRAEIMGYVIEIQSMEFVDTNKNEEVAPVEIQEVLQ
jgi:hypothetical protein